MLKQLFESTKDSVVWFKFQFSWSGRRRQRSGHPENINFEGVRSDVLTMFRDTKVDTRIEENTNWQIEKDFDLKSSHFEEGCFHVGAQDLIFVFFAMDSVCEGGE